MMNLGPKGTSTKYDQILNHYFPQRSDDLLYQLIENQTDTLLAAVLLELQEMNRGSDPLFPEDDRPEQQEARYFVTEQPAPVTSTKEQNLSFGFPADSVTIWGFDEPIYVAFRGSGDNRMIPLDPSDAPFTSAPQDGLGASRVWIRKASESTDDTSVKVYAV